MNDSLLLLVVVVATAPAFDFTQWLHDTANAMATSIATRALKRRVAAGLCALLNFAGAFLSIKVAATISNGIVDGGDRCARCRRALLRHPAPRCGPSGGCLMLATIIDFAALWKILLAALIVGVGLTAVFGEGAGAFERLRSHDTTAVVRDRMVVVLTAVICLAAAAAGVLAMTHK